MKPYLKHVQLTIAAYWHKRRTEALLAVIVLCVAGSMLLLAYQSNQLKQQAIANKNYNSQQLTAIKKVVDQINASSQTRTVQIQNLTTHIDCIATFFAQSDRSQIVLKNLDKCIIASNSGQGTGTGSKATAGAASNSAPKSTGQGGQTPAKQPATQSTPAPAPKNCTIDLLGLHLLCP